MIYLRTILKEPSTTKFIKAYVSMVFATDYAYIAILRSCRELIKYEVESPGSSESLEHSLIHCFDDW